MLSLISLQEVSFLTPSVALFALFVLLPLSAMCFARWREHRAALVFRLGKYPFVDRVKAVFTALTLLAIAGSAAFVLATPVVVKGVEHLVRTDAEVYFLCDNSRSMLAVPSRGALSRWDRLVDLGVGLRNAVPEVKMGIVCFTNRPLLHLYPSYDRNDFVLTLQRVAAVDKPPPSPYAPPLPGATGSPYPSATSETSRVTSLDTLGFVAQQSFFSKKAKKRVVVVVTDGETNKISLEAIRDILKQNRVRLVIVHIWGSHDFVFTAKGQRESYRSDPHSLDNLERLARVTQSPLLRGYNAGAVASVLRNELGSGPLKNIGKEERTVPIGEYGWFTALLFSILYLSSLLLFRKKKSS